MRRHVAPPSRHIVFLALLAVLLHSALPFIHGMLQVPARGYYASLCTVGSPPQQYWVALDDPGQPTPEQAQTPRCPLCLAGAHLALNPPSALLLTLRADLQQPQPQTRAQWQAPQQSVAAYQSRAPPAFSV